MGGGVSGLAIAILTHSTNSRGGVVHALELGEALTDLGHQAVVHAPGDRNARFFREARCQTLIIKAAPAGANLAETVALRSADYVRHFEQPCARRFDVFHAQDGISGNALATLAARGAIPGFARTVHHLDAFADTRLAALQTRSIETARALLTVSATVRDQLAAGYGHRATIVGNGVDRARFSPACDGSEPALRAKLGLGAGPIILAVGGIERRKNSLNLLDAFVALRESHPGAQLVIAGGASLLDHSEFQSTFHLRLAASGLPPRAVILSGPLPQEEFPGLYRLADVLAFPSVQEGFGLAVLEAMASGVPVAVSHIAPFTEYLGAEDAAWCDPADPDSIVEALARAIEPGTRRDLVARGAIIAARHSWRAVAAAHLPIYESLSEAVDA